MPRREKSNVQDIFAAVEGGDADCLAQLIAAGCDLETDSPNGRSPSILAQARGHPHCGHLIDSETQRRELLQDTPAASRRPRVPSRI